MATRAIRGATSVPENVEEQIIARTSEMVETALRVNCIRPEDIVSIVFAVTEDLDAAFPARAARELGLVEVPLLDMVSPSVKGSMPRVVRMLLTCNTSMEQSTIKHIYLGEAARLRPDLTGPASSRTPQDGR